MSKLLFSTVALVALGAASVASAADLATRPYTKAPPISPAYDWTGYYIGVFGGGGFSNHDITSAAGSANYGSGGGGIGGVDIGYNWS